MSRVALTADELVHTLKKTSIPTVLVEGQDDMQFYRWIESLLPVKADILPCDGRTTLLEVYQRRHEFSKLKIVFMADKDMWLFTSIPSEYGGIIWTSGYSIENDIIADSKIEGLLSHTEAVEYNSLITEIIKWFAFEVEEYRAGKESEQGVKVSKLIPVGSTTLCMNYLAGRGYRAPQNTTIEEITQDWRLKLRGKTLLGVLVRILGKVARVPAYGGGQLLEIGVKISPNRYVNTLVTQISASLGA